MNKAMKKILSSLMSLSLIAGTIAVPISASAEEITPLVAGDTVIKEWKFDFGSADDAADGYTAVTADRNYITEKDYGFIGLDEDSYKLSGRMDAFGMQKGQVIQLQAGGGTGLNDGIGSVGEDLFGNEGDVFYPTRFALKVEDEQYFRVKATVTTLDPTKDAEISLYTERKHPIFTDKTVRAGETYTAEFSVRTTPIYYQKSEPQGAIADGMVNVAVVGENSAIASLEIQQVETLPTFWVLGDSTVTDGNCALPFFRLQNYTGVGTGLTKYLPTTMAMVNEGEGGLNAADTVHFDMVKNRIKAGDYLYLEYGHNHKSDGTAGYLSCLNKYYDACHSVGANLIIVSPIERINTFTDGAYQHTLRGFAEAGEQYVADKVAAGATDIAYVDLNKYSLDFYNKVVTDNSGSADAIKFYFQTAKGGGTDTTHPNDAGAENLAYEFIKAAQTVSNTTQKAVLDGFLTDLRAETPNLVSEAITSLGAAPNDAWPTYQPPVDRMYPVVINDIKFDENGNAVSADVNVQQAQIQMVAYGIIVITVLNEDGTEKGKIYAVDQVDNSTGYGSQTITNFRSDITLAPTDTYSAIVMQAIDSPDGLIVDEAANTAYSAVYKPTDIAKQLITNENGDGNESFDFYGAVYEGDSASSLTEFNGWTGRGSAGQILTLGVSGETKYANIITDGAKNGAANQGSFYVAKDFIKEQVSEDTEEVVNIGTTGRYTISANIKYISGGGLNFKLVTGNTDKAPWGTQSLTAFTIANDGVVTIEGESAGQLSALDFTNIKYVLDMDLGTATISVAGGDEKTVNIPNYQTTLTEISPDTLTGFMFEANKVAVGIQISDLTVAKLKDVKLPTKTAKVAASNDAWGTVSITSAADAADDSAELAENSAVSISYNTDGAVIKTDAALNAVLIEAAYNNDGSLKEFKLVPVEFTEAGEKTIPVAMHSKLMLWDSLNGLVPLVSAINAELAYSDKSAELNTVMTAHAVANDGYVFMGWNDEAGTLISSDEDYTFRLRDDIALIAQFVKEPGVEDITDFSLGAESTFIKAAAGTTTTMKILNPVDASGTPMDKVTNADIAWSCDDENVTVDANGVVTIGDAFTTGDAATKDITITGVLNGISKTLKITTYSYAYYEVMTEGATNYDGVFMTIGGKTAIVFPGSSTTKKYTMGAPVALDKATTISFDNAWSGSNTCGQLRTLNFKDSNGVTLFSMSYSWNTLQVGGTDLGNAVAKDSWNTVTVAINPETKVVTVTAGGSSATTTLADGASDIAGIEFASAASVPAPDQRALGIGNIIISQ